MKILSKYKDYYDYLSGIYGVDPMLVLDRRISDNFSCIGKRVLTFYICGYRIDGYYDGNKFYYGENIKLVGKYIPENHWRKEHVQIDLGNKCWMSVYFKPTKLSKEDNVNEELNCPIIMTGYWPSDLRKFPQLSKYDFYQALPAEEIYKMLVEWLSNQRSKAESKPDSRTNTEKITSKGFDTKTSFRPNIKT